MKSRQTTPGANFRKYVAWFLLNLMAMNTIGYYSFLVLSRVQASTETEKRIQSNGGNDLGGHMILKFPLSIPYGKGNAEEYVDTRGEISYDENIYQLVKHRYYQDTLYIVCIRDDNATIASENLKEYSKSLQGENKENSAALKIVNLFVKYCASKKEAITTFHAGWSTPNVNQSKPSDHYSCYSELAIFHPPKTNT